ncbi:MAG: aminotransferase class I/II-fold pyridoxal phosphate-dependent enzyme [Muribaculaceae bacterium]|nr:aminotransferase class I/II-fold pyridoxal phosphate-dependent enzyme [Muribaculaceae bacterium]
MQAIILAAGMGRRLGEFTADNTKCMLEVNGIRLIDRMLHQLHHLNLSRIVIVIGYEGQKLKNYISKNYPDWRIVFVENNVYDKTNNIYSLWLARGLMAEEETLLLESDLIFEDAVLEAAVNSEYPDCALISKYETWMDGTMVKIDDENNIVNFIPKKDFKYSDTGSYYKTVNIYKFSKRFIVNHYLPFLEAYIRVLGENEYYEQVLRVITLIDRTGIKALPITGLHWYEIDDVQDLRIAETIFATPEERLKKLQHSFGGYWRYPSLLDFCYLVNPYFPKQKMIEEMKANFEPLLRDYPSGMNVNSLLAAKYFGIRHDYSVVGNGAAELIKSLMSLLDGKVGIIYPTFEEYPNRLEKDRIVAYHPENHDFSYSASDIIKFFSQNRVENLLIVNPDNPSGNLIDREGLNRLMEWAKNDSVRLIIDESFVDFADDASELTLLHNDILENHPFLYVMKSISKSYGVPGLRLGVLATSDTQLIQKMRKDVGIWNINSFAEFYMQIFGKYEKDYFRSCDKFREERAIFFEELSAIPFLRVIPSQANYFLCEITSRFTSHEIALRLLTESNILIKDCSSKKGFPADKQYIRIAIRDRKDDHKLTEALKVISNG